MVWMGEAFVGSRVDVASLSGSVGLFSSENDGFRASLVAGAGTVFGFCFPASFAAAGAFTPFSITSARLLSSDFFSGLAGEDADGFRGSCADPYR